MCAARRGGHMSRCGCDCDYYVCVWVFNRKSFIIMRQYCWTVGLLCFALVPDMGCSHGPSPAPFTISFCREQKTNRHQLFFFFSSILKGRSISSLVSISFNCICIHTKIFFFFSSFTISFSYKTQNIHKKSTLEFISYILFPTICSFYIFQHLKEFKLKRANKSIISVSRVATNIHRCDAIVATGQQTNTKYFFMRTMLSWTLIKR